METTAAPGALVATCEHLGLDTVGAESVSGLCTGELVSTAALTGTPDVIFTCERTRSRGDIQHRLVAAGMSPSPVPVLVLDSAGAPVALADVASTLVAAWVSTERRATGWTFERRMQISRRRLLHLEHPQMIPIPSVDRDECAFRSGCRICSSACPHQAISFEQGPPSVDTGRCRACGLCVGACPTGAMWDPGAVDLMALVETAIERTVSDGAVGVVFACAHADAFRPGQGWVLAPVTAMPTVTVLSMLAPLALGAAAVAVAACGHCPSEELTHRRIDFSRGLLESFGFSRDRLQLAPAGDLQPPALSPGWSPSTLRPAGIGEVILHMATAAAGTARLEHGASPLAIITIGDACTGSVACVSSCPTGALDAHDDGQDLVVDFDPALCTSCERCVAVCPETRGQAILTWRGVDVGRIAAGRTTMRRHAPVLCMTCGAPIAPDGMMRRIADLLGDDLSSTASVPTAQCPRCMERATLRSGSDLWHENG